MHYRAKCKIAKYIITVICMTAVCIMAGCEPLYSASENDYTELQQTPVRSVYKTQTPDVPDNTVQPATDVPQSIQSEGILVSQEDINLTDTDGRGKHYTFQYDGDTYIAEYTEDNWKIIDSYKIENTEDIVIICLALIAEHPIHGKDMASYRTAEDMAYEWIQHNIAYGVLSEDDPLRDNAKDVDLNPADQGRLFISE